MAQFRFTSVDGINRLKTEKDIRPGDNFYSEDVSGDVNWKATLKRKKLVIIQILDINNDIVKIMLFKQARANGRNFLKTKRVQIKLNKLFYYLKTGKVK